MPSAATPRQREVLQEIAAGIQRGNIPSLREMGQTLGIAHARIDQHIKGLITKGLVKKREPRKSRAWVITEGGWEELGRQNSYRRPQYAFSPIKKCHECGLDYVEAFGLCACVRRDLVLQMREDFFMDAKREVPHG